MNLLLRYIWVIIGSFFRPRISFFDKATLSLRIFPNDLDVNRHLNNGRYLSLLDLVSLDLFLRSGLARQMARLRIRPMVGGSIISYRKGLSLFERCTMTIQWQGRDDRWHYFRFTFLNARDQLSATGYFKGALVSRQGYWPTGEAFEQFGFDARDRELPPAVTHWLASEGTLMPG